MARKKPAHPPVMRTDLLPSNMTDRKETAVLALLRAYRAGAVLLGREQWRLLFETGRFDKNHDTDKVTFAAVIGAANRVQMCRYQVVGQVQGWVSNRANEFRDTVTASGLPPDVKHMLHTVNRAGAWFSRADVVMKGTGEVVPPDGKPKELVPERLDFRHSDLSRRLNAILRNCGRSIIEAKLADLKDRYGIMSTEVNPAYSSRTCSCCGYVDKRNRPSQGTFRCLWCGNTLHADLNAAANIEARRARPNGWLFQGKAAVLAERVREFGERRVKALRHDRSGSRGAPADPRLTNPYFGGVKPVLVRSTGSRKVSKSPKTQALVAA